MEWLGHVSLTESGRIVVGAARVPAEDVLDALASGSIEDVLRSFPGLSEADVRATVAWASELTASLGPIREDEQAALRTGLASVREGRTVSLDEALRRLESKLR